MATETNTIHTITDATSQANWTIDPVGIARGTTNSGARITIVWEDGIGDYEAKGSEPGTDESGTFADIADLRVLLAD